MASENPATSAPSRPDLVNRCFSATEPNRLWVCDLTYVATCSGFSYVAFVIDVFSRRIVGWRVSSSLRTDLALDALEMAIWSRQKHDLSGLVHHSDSGVQGRLKESSQRSRVERTIEDHRVLPPAFSKPGSCAVGC
jgi:putative transposase